jgi:chemotaxis protein MotA
MEPVPFTPIALVDPVALTIVLAGTAIATLARAGWRDSAAAVQAGHKLLRRGFDENANRTALARSVGMAQHRGVRAMDAPLPPDPELALAVEILVRTASADAMRRAFAEAQALRASRAARAAQIFELGGEIAPVFGLVGTLFALTQMAPVAGVDASASTFGAIATAVLSTLYGVLAAHGLCLPFAATIARRSEREEAARTALIDWFAGEIEPRRTPLQRVA